jgi:hypothetical protein
MRIPRRFPLVSSFLLVMCLCLVLALSPPFVAGGNVPPQFPLVADVQTVALDPVATASTGVFQEDQVDFFTVPEGEWLVVEFVSASVEVEPNHSARVVFVVKSPTGANVQHRLVLVPQTTSADKSVLVAAQALRVYAKGGDILSMRATDPDDGIQFVSGTFSGYLIDAP